MTREEIANRINTVLAEDFEVKLESINPEASMKEVLDLDSLDYVDLVVLLEQNFGLRVKGSDFAEISTFEDFYQYIFRHIN
ncbi:MAG: phosphopantetheine-binding protein [Bacteroidales bacterium]|jgi:acyl carrier protein|nr:phosphopantetheine-binding protein [Bacteroidales bacterium]